MIERAQIYAWSIQPIGKTPPIFIGLYGNYFSEPSNQVSEVTKCGESLEAKKRENTQRGIINISVEANTQYIRIMRLRKMARSSTFLSGSQQKRLEVTLESSVKVNKRFLMFQFFHGVFFKLFPKLGLRSQPRIVLQEYFGYIYSRVGRMQEL